ncbi:(Fe-S)-binding protein [Candidatus Viridilinea mediisalina]|uniref:Cysteine-rich domain-containing protein n=1 Tax=Candidatus Viridilinea mediisalina TaxID=2024553 RepID=A0A2A6RM35_9CHLR|nr:(Fe-S)-binding protein [Candidatus Viridilinea mediisalina]PDW04003.1 hypothetical protein CJ255_05955 [Candidatus Viridilinea mediisalina]
MVTSAQRRATLFVTCIVDQVYPTIGQASVQLLESQGVRVHVPKGLTCCGQMAFNAGFRDESYAIAARTIEVLRNQGDVVLPSGSCTAMIRHLYAELFAHSPYANLAHELAGRTYELSEYLVDRLGVSDVGAHYQGRIAYHDACHGLRYLGVGPQARTLLNAIRAAEVRPLDGCSECCGFGGLFAVKHAAISETMLARKLAQIEASGADLIVTGDASCMTQIAGGLSRQQSNVRVLHIAEVLAEVEIQRITPQRHRGHRVFT